MQASSLATASGTPRISLRNMVSTRRLDSVREARRWPDGVSSTAP